MISLVSPLAWILLVVYNGQSLDVHCKLWRELTCMSYLSLPWLVLGDFNAVIAYAEHKGGFFYYYSRKANFLFFF